MIETDPIVPIEARSSGANPIDTTGIQKDIPNEKVVEGSEYLRSGESGSVKASDSQIGADPNISLGTLFEAVNLRSWKSICLIESLCRSVVFDEESIDGSYPEALLAIAMKGPNVFVWEPKGR